MSWRCAACGETNPPGTRFCGHCGTPAGDGPAPQRDSDFDVERALRSFISDQVVERLVAAGGELAEERRLVTSLFADLSGFTPLADRLDPETLVEIVEPVISRMAEIVHEFDGYVAKYSGDAVLALFGAPVSHEDDAERALTAALAMHEELGKIVTELPSEAAHLRLHVGVNSGHVIAHTMGSDMRMDYSVLGDAVNIAQRLESSAPPGETYVGELTHRLAAGRFLFEPVGELSLKGKDEPVGAWRLVGQRHTVLRPSGASALIARTEELAAVERLFAASDPLVVALTGEPGLGKTAVKETARTMALDRGVRWLETRCISYGKGLPYWPFAELVRQTIGARAEDHPDEVARKLRIALTDVDLEKSFGYVAGLIGIAIDDPMTSEPEALRRHIHDSMSSWLRALAASGQTVIAIEDLHWADSSTIDLAREVIRKCTDVPIGFLFTARPEGDEALDQIAEVAPLIRKVRLQPFDAATATRQITSLLGGEAPAELLAAVIDKASGNPFFIEEIVRALREDGSLFETSRGWHLRPGWNTRFLPATIESLLSSRIDQLPHRAAAVLQAASVIGRRAPERLLRAVCDDVEGLDLAVEQLVAAGMLEYAAAGGSDRVYRSALSFRHALVQETAYGRILRRRRRELHARVAEQAQLIYGAGDDVIDLLARHLYLGGAGSAAIEALIRAGRRARSLFANDVAALHLERALDLMRDDVAQASRLGELLAELGQLHAIRGAYEKSYEAWREAHELEPSVATWRGMAAAMRNLSRYAEVHALLDEALRQEWSPSERAPLLLERGWTLAREGRTEATVNALVEGLEDCSEVDDPTKGHLLLQLARIESQRGQWAEALDHATSAAAMFERLRDRHGSATALRILGGAYREMGELDRASETLQHGLHVAELTGNVEEIAGCLINLGVVEQKRGRVEAGIECDLKAIDEFERVGLASGRAIAFGNLAEKLHIAGRLDAAAAAAATALEVAHGIGHLPTIADVSRTQASIALDRGDWRAAARDAEAAADVNLEMSQVIEAAECLDIAAAALGSQGDAQGARSLRDRAQSLRIGATR